MNRTVFALAVSSTFGGCYNHITGSPPTPPWYRLTKEGRDEQDRRARPAPKTPHEIWTDALFEVVRRYNECSHLAATHPHVADHVELYAACDAERAAGQRAADEAFERSDPEGWRAEVARFPSLVRTPKGP